MQEAPGGNSKWRWWKSLLKRWDFWFGVAGVGITAAIVVSAIVGDIDRVRRLQNYGYLGAFIISIIGGATILAPVPMTPVIFALGSVMKPPFAPILGPIFVGLSSGAGETVGGIIIYMTGFSGGSRVLTGGHPRLQNAYVRVMGWMQRRGSIILFVLSAVINPFFYPAAITAGVLRFGLKKFILITFAGKIVKGITVALAGYWGLGSLLRALGVPI